MFWTHAKPVLPYNNYSIHANHHYLDNIMFSQTYMQTHIHLYVNPMYNVRRSSTANARCKAILFRWSSPTPNKTPRRFGYQQLVRCATNALAMVIAFYIYISTVLICCAVQRGTMFNTPGWIARGRLAARVPKTVLPGALWRAIYFRWTTYMVQYWRQSPTKWLAGCVRVNLMIAQRLNVAKWPTETH